MKILVTGAAGFIGAAVSQYLINRGDEVVGIDNLNDYYDVNLKEISYPDFKKREDSNLFKTLVFERLRIKVFTENRLRHSIEAITKLLIEAD